MIVVTFVRYSIRNYHDENSFHDHASRGDVPCGVRRRTACDRAAFPSAAAAPKALAAGNVSLVGWVVCPDTYIGSWGEGAP